MFLSLKIKSLNLLYAYFFKMDILEIIFLYILFAFLISYYKYFCAKISFSYYKLIKKYL